MDALAVPGDAPLEMRIVGRADDETTARTTTSGARTAARNRPYLLVGGGAETTTPASGNNSRNKKGLFSSWSPRRRKRKEEESRKKKKSAAEEERFTPVLSVEESVVEDVIQEEPDPEAPSDEEEFHFEKRRTPEKRKKQQQHFGRLASVKLRSQRTASPASIRLHDTSVVSQPHDRRHPEDEDEDGYSSVEEGAFRNFQKIKLQVEVAEQNQKRNRRVHKVEDRLQDVRGYRQLWRDYQAIQQELETSSLPDEETPTKEKEKDSSHKKRSKSFDLKQSRTWYYDFQGGEFDLPDDEDDQSQPNLSLHSHTSLEAQRALFAEKRRHRRRKKKEARHRRNQGSACMEMMVGGKAVTRNNGKSHDYGPVHRHLSAQRLPAHQQDAEEQLPQEILQSRSITDMEVAFSTPDTAEKGDDDGANTVISDLDDFSYSVASSFQHHSDYGVPWRRRRDPEAAYAHDDDDVSLKKKKKSAEVYDMTSVRQRRLEIEARLRQLAREQSSPAVTVQQSQLTEKFDQAAKTPSPPRKSDHNRLLHVTSPKRTSSSSSSVAALISPDDSAVSKDPPAESPSSMDAVPADKFEKAEAPPPEPMPVKLDRTKAPSPELQNIATDAEGLYAQSSSNVVSPEDAPLSNHPPANLILLHTRNATTFNHAKAPAPVLNGVATSHKVSVVSAPVTQIAAVLVSPEDYPKSNHPPDDRSSLDADSTKQCIGRANKPPPKPKCPAAAARETAPSSSPPRNAAVPVSPGDTPTSKPPSNPSLLDDSSYAGSPSHVCAGHHAAGEISLLSYYTESVPSPRLHRDGGDVANEVFVPSSAKVKEPVSNEVDNKHPPTHTKEDLQESEDEALNLRSPLEHESPNLAAAKKHASVLEKRRLYDIGGNKRFPRETTSNSPVDSVSQHNLPVAGILAGLTDVKAQPKIVKDEATAFSTGRSGTPKSRSQRPIRSTSSPPAFKEKARATSKSFKQESPNILAAKRNAAVSQKREIFNGGNQKHEDDGGKTNSQTENLRDKHSGKNDVGSAAARRELSALPKPLQTISHQTATKSAHKSQSSKNAFDVLQQTASPYEERSASTASREAVTPLFGPLPYLENKTSVEVDESLIVDQSTDSAFAELRAETPPKEHAISAKTATPPKRTYSPERSDDDDFARSSLLLAEQVASRVEIVLEKYRSLNDYSEVDSPDDQPPRIISPRRLDTVPN
jgi:hypothetical protein